MIDQMNSDYVKFARSGGLTEKEIFNKHILKNAAIPIVHGDRLEQEDVGQGRHGDNEDDVHRTDLVDQPILLPCHGLTGAIITERVYVVPGAGNLLTEAINKYDNSVIVGMTMFYSVYFRETPYFAIAAAGVRCFISAFMTLT